MKHRSAKDSSPIDWPGTAASFERLGPRPPLLLLAAEQLLRSSWDLLVLQAHLAAVRRAFSNADDAAEWCGRLPARLQRPRKVHVASTTRPGRGGLQCSWA